MVDKSCPYFVSGAGEVGLDGGCSVQNLVNQLVGRASSSNGSLRECDIVQGAHERCIKYDCGNKRNRIAELCVQCGCG